MTGYLEKRITRFRAYRLGSAGSSFSYFDGSRFTLMEGRITDVSRPMVNQEMALCDVSRVSCLHITSWDNDHCVLSELKEILANYLPEKIEYPGYPPTTETGKNCLAQIQAYQKLMATVSVTVTVNQIGPEYIASLNPAKELGYRDVFYHPKYLSKKSNDNSTVKLFRSGCFNVASLGDVEDPQIGVYLRGSRLFAREVDVLILAHHGADNGFTSRKFLNIVRPTIAICSSNYDNEYDHPRDEIRELLREQGIPLFTTKTGDVVIHSTGSHEKTYRLINLKAGSTEISSSVEFVSKKSKIFGNFNFDTIKEIYRPRRTIFPR